MKREVKWSLGIIGVGAVVIAIAAAFALSPGDLQVRECGVTVECPLVDFLFQVSVVAVVTGAFAVAFLLVYGRIKDGHWHLVQAFFTWGIVGLVFLRLIPVLWYSLLHPCTGPCS